MNAGYGRGQVVARQCLCCVVGITGQRNCKRAIQSQVFGEGNGKGRLSALQIDRIGYQTGSIFSFW